MLDFLFDDTEYRTTDRVKQFKTKGCVLDALESRTKRAGPDIYMWHVNIIELMALNVCKINANSLG